MRLLLEALPPKPSGTQASHRPLLLVRVTTAWIRALLESGPRSQRHACRGRPSPIINPLPTAPWSCRQAHVHQLCQELPAACRAQPARVLPSLQRGNWARLPLLAKLATTLEIDRRQ